MPNLVQKTIHYLRVEGPLRVAARIALYPAKLVRQRRLRAQILNIAGTEERFTEIYRKNYWGSTESVSGVGSTLEYTENLRCQLPLLIRQFKIASIFDAPCGDFHWIQHVLRECPLDYVGGDIVAPLIDSHNAHYSTGTRRFVHLDITKDALPPSDLMICRDCLFHLSFSDIKAFLANFLTSGIPYLLTTNHILDEPAPNVDIVTGDFRQIDLFSAPFNLPRDVLFRFDDWKAPQPKREMCLWSAEQVSAALSRA